ncbi:MAG TPA: TolC family protein [Caulobacteraceae bacterium]|jgi:NodT family efflux transporter outer membrane factor (OMF) lipoprotein
MRRVLIVMAAAAPLLAACATDRSLREADLRLPAQFSSTGGATSQAAALDRWWTLYGDPELESLVDQALAASTDARAAQARLEEAAALRRSRNRQLYIPKGDLQGSASVTQTEVLEGSAGGFGGQGAPAGQSNNQSLTFPVSWEIDVFGRNRAARDIIRGDFAAARFNYEATRAALAGQVASSLFQARGVAVQLQDAQETLRIQQEIARVTGIRAERGLAPSSEAARANAELAQSEAEVARLDAELRAATRALLTLVGRPAETLDALVIAADLYDPPAAPAAVPGLLLARRPDVREAEARIRSASGALRGAELALFPRFTLQPSVGLSRIGSDAFTSATGFWTLGAGLLLPILDRPRLMAEIDVSGARAEQAVIAYERAVQTAFSEADRALIQLEADRARVRTLTAGEANAREAYDAARRGYTAGLIDLQRLLDAERAWRGTRAALAGARTTALQRSVQTFQALGGGWSPETTTTSAGTRG